MQQLEEDYIKLSFLYMEYRNTFNLEYQRYGYFKNMIKYITGIGDQKTIRNIFQKLLNKNIFDKIKVGKQTKYHFNPYNKPLPKRSLIVHFN
tara:strand:- start:97 stop:372 length:276 start_codon:yes stop_codon:yes gene_type:complete